MKTRQMITFFSAILLALSVSMFSFLPFKTFKLQSNESSPFALSSALQYTQLHDQDDIFKPVNINIIFLRKICYLLEYNMFCSHLITIWPSMGYKYFLRDICPCIKNCNVSTERTSTKDKVLIFNLNNQLGNCESLLLLRTLLTLQWKCFQWKRSSVKGNSSVDREITSIKPKKLIILWN